MKWGSGGGPPGADDEARLEREDMEALERGELPGRVVRRLSSHRKGSFTSDLSVREWALCREAGCKPLGQVMGSSIYHVGWTRTMMGGWMGGGELEVLTEAHLEVRRRAIGRLVQEAALLGAHGVIGVRLKARRYDFGPDLLEFSAQGTAIAMPAQTDASEPFASDLSGQAFVKLLRAGYVPRGFAYGITVYYLYSDWQTQWSQMSWRNQEVQSYTQAVYGVRQLAEQRLRADARRVGGTRLVGVRQQLDSSPIEVDQGQGHRTDYIVTCVYTGTAIARAMKPSAEAASRPVLSLGRD